MTSQRLTERLVEIQDWLAQCLGGAGPFSITPLAGGISPRRFFRVEAPGFGSAVVMDVPAETPEVELAARLGRAWPFLEVRTLLEAAGVRVPRLLAAACERGLLLVEDLGVTLAEHLEAHPDARVQLYERAVRDLAIAQRKLESLPHDSIVSLRAFDEALLESELDHYREFGIEARGLAFSEQERREFATARRFLIDAIVRLPRGFVHRDYQSRNLLVLGDGEEPALGWIDFQDALLGPRAYDLVALLCDSYQPFDRGFVEHRLDDFAGERGLDARARAALGREFDLVTVQRKLKDAGRFVFVDRNKGDASFLRFVEPTLEIVAQALDRLSDVPELRVLAELARRRPRLRR